MTYVRNHDAEKIYMEQLRNMETAAYILGNDISNHKNRIKKLSTPIRQEEMPKKSKYTDDFNSKCYIGIVTTAVMTWILLTFFKWAFEGVSNLNVVLMILRIIGYGTIAICILCLIVHKSNEKSEYNKAVEKTIQANKRNMLISQKNKNLAEELSKQIPDLVRSYHDACKIKNGLYNINWIPNRYRNIKVIYYIHDMVTTSNIGIDEALKYYLLQEANNKLDAILEKLDTIIFQQSRMIMNQAVIQAQNRELLDRTETALNQLASIEENTQASAEYAELAASYSEASAYLNLALYFKN